MNLEDAKEYVTQSIQPLYSKETDDSSRREWLATFKQKMIENVNAGLDNLGSYLSDWKEENISRLVDIEKINPSYFPGLSKAAVKTILDLHSANADFTVEELLTTVAHLANRGRPWESLKAFSHIAGACPAQMNSELITYLLGINSDILEISGHEIKSKTSEAPEVAEVRFFSPKKHIDVKGFIGATLERFGMPSSHTSMRF